MNTAKKMTRPVRLSGRFSFAVATTAFAIQDLHPAIMDDRANRMALLYELWRPIKVIVSSQCRETTFCYQAARVYASESVVPTTTEQLQDYPYFAHGTGLYGAPFPSFEVPLKFFVGTDPIKWYQCDISSLVSNWEAPLTVYSYCPFATLNHDVWIEYEFEFANPGDPDVITSRLRKMVDETKTPSSASPSGVNSSENRGCTVKVKDGTGDFECIPPGSPPAKVVLSSSEKPAPKVASLVRVGPRTIGTLRAGLAGNLSQVADGE